MASVLNPRLEILPEPQRRFWPELATVPDRFVLYGGTAIALRCAHRTSEDFDFFSNVPFEPDDLERELPFLRGAERLQSSRNTLVVTIDRGGAVKVSFFGGLSLRRVADPEITEGPRILVASLLDLAATKMAAVQSRAEAKDYIDVAELLRSGIHLGAALSAARAVHGSKFNPFLSLKALSYFGDGDLNRLSDEVRQSLGAAVREVDPHELPTLSPCEGGIAP